MWLKLDYTMEEEHDILTYNGLMFSLPHFNFQLKYSGVRNGATWRFTFTES